MASLSVVAAPTGAVTDLSIPQAESALSGVREAYTYLEQCRERAERAKSILVECVLDARRVHGAKLADIAAALGTSRQYVQKIVREAEAGEAEDEAEAAYFTRQAEKDYARDKEGIGQVNCGSCGAFKSLPSSVCKLCGDEPGTYNGSTWETDEAHYGHRVLR